MTNEDIRRIALEQSAEDMGCKPEDFLAKENIVVPFKLGKNARKYLKEPIICNLASYGNNIVAGVTEDVADLVKEYIGRYEFYHCFETPNMHWLDDRMKEKGHRVCFMAEYYLPDVNNLPELSCDYELRVLNQEDFADLYKPEWGNALCADRRQLDVFGVGAYDREKLIGLSACSADGEEMWQIGVDVLQEYRQQGIASAITARLVREILDRDKVPFYCTAWSNIRSVRNGIKSGLIPAWAEMTVKPAAVVDGFNEAYTEK